MHWTCLLLAVLPGTLRGDGDVTRPPAAAVAAVVERLTPAIQKAMQEGDIPSCAVALVDDHQVLWQAAFGYSNLWSRTPAQVDSVYLIGSTFKTMSTAAFLQRIEAGELRLDDPVHDHLTELAIRGESPEHPITFRHLLTHTSGLPGAFGGHPVWGDSVPEPLAEYLARSLVTQSAPLERVVYSNLAYSLLAQIVSDLSGQAFPEYMQTHIFQPLEMTSTVFQPTPEIDARLTVPYLHLEASDTLVPAERLKADVWPAGIVYGTIEDQARWLCTVLARGQWKGHRILRAETLERCMQPQYPQFLGQMAGGWGNETAGYGLTWWCCTKDGDRHIAHSGSVPGYTAFLEGNWDERLGFAILTNGNRAHSHLVQLADLALRWLKEARTP